MAWLTCTKCSFQGGGSEFGDLAVGCLCYSCAEAELRDRLLDLRHRRNDPGTSRDDLAKAIDTCLAGLELE